MFLAFACISAVLILGEFLSGLIIGSMGATAFIIFAYPKAETSRAKCIIGGYLCGAAAGTLLWFIESSLIVSFVNYSYVHAAVCAGAAVLTMLLMASAKLPHPPAAAFAIGIADNDNAVFITVSALAGVLFFCFIKHCFRNHLEDLFH